MEREEYIPRFRLLMENGWKVDDMVAGIRTNIAYADLAMSSLYWRVVGLPAALGSPLYLRGYFEHLELEIE